MSERISGSQDGGPLSANQIEENFADLHPPFSAVKAMVESSRCLFCYDAPCVEVCPTSIDIPKFIHQIRTHNLDGSAKTILSANIMGGTCARVCPTEILCEGSCVRTKSGEEAVKIGQLQRYAVDHFMQSDKEHPFTRAANTGKKIAIIGAGPAGLACAHRLAMFGNDVVIYEAKPKAGGLNEYGLAAYKMVDNFAQDEVEFLLQIGGIKIEYNKALGMDFSLSTLTNDYDSVFIGAGLGDVNALQLDGEDKDGVFDAIKFIEEIRQSGDREKIKVGENIIVIGGGNTAIDAAVQAKRLGANNVTMVYRRGAAQMGATDWEQDLAKTNGVTVLQWAKPSAIKGNGKVEGMTFEQTILKGDKLEGTGAFFDLPADQVLKAIGQTLSDGPLKDIVLEGHKIKVDDNYQTSLPGVFAGGDCINSGEDLTVQAVDDGAKAAIAINRFLTQS